MLVNDVARAVTDPRHDATVHERAAAFVRLYGDEAQRRELDATGRYRLAALGLGSDWTPFLQHLGIPSLDYSFDGEADSGVYHSIYDTFDFYDRFGDPGYIYGVKLAEVSGRTMLRLANVDLLPFDFSAMAGVLLEYASEVEALAATRTWGTMPFLELAELSNACDVLSTSAARFSEARSAFETSGVSLDSAYLADINAIIRRAEQQLAPAGGLPGHPWYRHTVYAPGYDTGYGVKTLPGVREAVERRDWGQARSETERLERAIENYAARIDAATEVLERTTTTSSRSH